MVLLPSALFRYRFYLIAFAGVFLHLGFAPWGILVVACISFTSLYCFIERESSVFAVFKLVWVWGFFFFASGIYNFVIALSIDSQKLWYSVPLFITGFGGLFALLPALFLSLYKKCVCDDYRVKVILFAFFFACSEWIEGSVIAQFPWFLSGYVWFFSLPMLQIVSIVGIYGLSFITIVLCVLPFVSLIKNEWKSCILSFGLFLSIFIWGSCRLYYSSDLGYADDVKLRIVQPNIVQTNKLLPSHAKDIVNHHLDLTKSDGFQDITHVIWPETAIPIVLSESSTAFLHLLRGAVPKYLITGVVKSNENNVFNSLFVIDRNGDLVASYDKIKLVPFGEYIPFNHIIPFDKIVSLESDFTSGDNYRASIKLEGIPPFSPVICYEIIFPGLVMDAKNQAKWLLNITNDARFGNSSAPYQHLNIAKVRAIEEGVTLVRAANSGISAIFDGYGRLIGSLPLDKEGVLDSKLPLSIDGGTIFTKISPLINWIFCSILLLILLIFTFKMHKMRKRI